jgi:hypothetical protein
MDSQAGQRQLTKASLPPFDEMTVDGDSRKVDRASVKAVHRVCVILCRHPGIAVEKADAILLPTVLIALTFAQVRRADAPKVSGNRRTCRNEVLSTCNLGIYS